MHMKSQNLGPAFATIKRQDNPSDKVEGLSLEMQWGSPTHTARLYRNIRDHATDAFQFEDVVIHEDDVIEDIEYQPHLARKTSGGMYYPLCAHLLALYNRKLVNRNLLSVLAELDRLLPPERRVTIADSLNFCRTLGKETAQASPKPPVIPSIGLLSEDLEVQGFRLTGSIPEEGQAKLSIGWLPKPDGRVFFTGILELRPTNGGIVGQWMLPGPCGVCR